MNKLKDIISVQGAYIFVYVDGEKEIRERVESDDFESLIGRMQLAKKNTGSMEAVKLITTDEKLRKVEEQIQKDLEENKRMLQERYDSMQSIVNSYIREQNTYNEMQKHIEVRIVSIGEKMQDIREMEERMLEAILTREQIANGVIQDLKQKADTSFETIMNKEREIAESKKNMEEFISNVDIEYSAVMAKFEKDRDEIDLLKAQIIDKINLSVKEEVKNIVTEFERKKLDIIDMNKQQELKQTLELKRAYYESELARRTKIELDKAEAVRIRLKSLCGFADVNLADSSITAKQFKAIEKKFLKIISEIEEFPQYFMAELRLITATISKYNDGIIKRSATLNKGYAQRFLEEEKARSIFQELKNRILRIK